MPYLYINGARVSYSMYSVHATALAVQFSSAQYLCADWIFFIIILRILSVKHHHHHHLECVCGDFNFRSEAQRGSDLFSFWKQHFMQLSQLFYFIKKKKKIIMLTHLLHWKYHLWGWTLETLTFKCLYRAEAVPGKDANYSIIQYFMSLATVLKLRYTILNTSHHFTVGMTHRIGSLFCTHWSQLFRYS